MTTPKFSLKDQLFNAGKVAFLANAIADIYPKFDKKGFHESVIVAFPALELKERITHIRHCLKRFLPEDYRMAVAILLKSLPPPLDENRTDDDFGDFIYAPYSDFVAHYGCNSTEYAFSLAALKEMTQRFSAEDSIRFFINAFPEETLDVLLSWTNSSNYHVRRLCSEGTRPKLPWARKLNLEVGAGLPILQRLYADNTRYVTRSVANHLNDIAKSEPDTVIQVLTKWKKSQRQENAEMNFILRHALRTLVKTGHSEALNLLGFGDSQYIVLENLQSDKVVKVDAHLNFSFELKVQEAKSVVIDYMIHFQTKQGTLNSKKVFKLKTLSTKSDMPVIISKRHAFKANMTTRTLYAGKHKVEIQVNGTILTAFEFELQF